ncbi:MAG: WbqC family protein [Planctomycetales bacterium]|nr:WbqC family protein [Planctomycetales bacterium]
MKLGIMQPYFLPYLGYFDLICRTDQWIVFDTPQYIRHGWVNRNRILHPQQGWQYIKVPLAKHARETPINQIKIAEPDQWHARVLSQLQHYKKLGRYFSETYTFLQDALQVSTDSLAELNVHLLDEVCQHISIPFRWRRFSEMQLELGPIHGPGDWALRICEAVGATEYVNPPGGASLFDVAAFERHGIRLQIQAYTPPEYDTRQYTFEPGLSIVDVMMWCHPTEIRQFLMADTPTREVSHSTE